MLDLRSSRLIACLTLAGVIVPWSARSFARSYPDQTRPEIAALVAELRTPETAWGASTRLQKLGIEAVPALIANLRQDPFDTYHGNHSETMKVLEKIGEPAQPALASALTTTLLASAAPEDVRYVRSLIGTMARSDAGRAARDLLRVARSAADPHLREEALRLLPHQEAIPLTTPARWRPCFTRGHPLRYDRCPDADAAAAIRAELQPLLAEISTVLEEAATPAARLESARLLVQWGTEPFRARGQKALHALAMRDASFAGNAAIQALGELAVFSSADLIAGQVAGADDERKRAIAEALFRLNDPRYFTVASALMSSRDEQSRRRAIELAGATKNTRFVPALIGRLRDRGWNGVTTAITKNGRTIERRHTLAEDASEALAQLTFETFGTDVSAWRHWWTSNRGVAWKVLLRRFVENRSMRLASAEPYVMNRWIEQVAHADDRALLPLLARILDHPRIDTSSRGPNLTSGGEPPTVLLLLAELTQQGDATARNLIAGCMTSRDRAIRDHCPFALALFDKQQALGWLARRLRHDDPYESWKAAESLVYLGDSRGIPALIEQLGAKDATTRSLAFDTLKHYTQEDLAFDPDALEGPRREMIDGWRRWWAQQRDFRVRVREAEIDFEVFL